MAVKKIDAGELRRTVVLRQPVSVRNNEGGKETSYVDAITCRAKIEQNNSQRAIETAPALLNTDSVWIRLTADRSAVANDWLVKYDKIDHVIHSIDTDELSGFIKLIVKVKNG